MIDFKKDEVIDFKKDTYFFDDRSKNDFMYKLEKVLYIDENIGNNILDAVSAGGA